MTNLETKNPMFGLYMYPFANEIRERHQDIMWFSHEIKVHKDVQDYMVNMPRESFELAKTILQSFVEIEQEVGDIWSSIADWFPHSEIDGACSTISFAEKAVHSFFYQQMSDVLNIDPEETQKVQEEVRAIHNKLTYIRSVMSNASENKLLTLFTLAMIEQVMLFSNFAMLKSFQSNGNNLIPNTISGVDYVINDELIHGEFASYLFQQLIHESNLTEQQELSLQIRIARVINEIFVHENDNIDYMFRDVTGSINGVTPDSLKSFIKQRIDSVVVGIGYKSFYNDTDLTISNWFFKGANSIKMHDFFIKGTNSYSRKWSEEEFSRIGLNNERD